MIWKNWGVEAPFYQGLPEAFRVQEEDGKRLYPVTMEQTMALKDQFPPELSGKKKRGRR